MQSQREGRGVWRWLVILAVLSLGCFIGVALGWTLSAPLAFFGNNASLIPDEPPAPVAATAVQESAPPAPSTSSAGGDLETRIENVYRRVGPSVVNITSRSVEYDFFFRPTPREGSGSGFFYDRQGHIVTNFHMIENADEIQVALADGQVLPAQVVGADPSNDLAVIRIDAPPDSVSPATIGDSSSLRVGQFVMAIGNPFGLEQTLTVGVVSSLGRVIESPNERFIGEVIQTDAPINPGNSGGPLINLEGEVIGVNTAILSPSGASAGIGFAIPARTVDRVVTALIADGRYPHPSLGVQVFELTPQVIQILERAGMRVATESGLVIASVAADGPADQAGLHGALRQVRAGNVILPIGGDIITAINGASIETRRDLIVFLETQTRVGEAVEVTIIRDGEEQRVTVVLDEV